MSNNIEILEARVRLIKESKARGKAKRREGVNPEPIPPKLKPATIPGISRRIENIKYGMET